MNEELKVVLLDRDSIYLRKLKKSLERKGSINVVGMTGSGSEALGLIEAYKADIIIMDILLSEKDGFWVLENMKNLNTYCSSIIVSAIDGDLLVRKAITYGAEYYMAKPVQGELLVERMYQLLGIEEVRRGIETVVADKVMEEKVLKRKSETEIEAEISMILSKMGIPASIKGYHFIRTAVLMTLVEPTVLKGITKGLYPDIGKMYQTTGNRVERAIRHAIEAGWKKNGAEIYYEATGYFTEHKPTNAQFIATLAEYFKMTTNKSA